ncbi:hypothetical protein B879_00021 [Cecembia lonarensis LW9]|uniref:Uncharacterized protein n=1 Tax=Cecembia lonarensis (strain CCUG 58316 / KCTC 22772 / LW9) TaxID=1225176 RepID=K1LGD2_CECL9|nr:hypothetical protein B879_00021 [Cecembia lonarensis LW9]
MKILIFIFLFQTLWYTANSQSGDMQFHEVVLSEKKNKNKHLLKGFK